MELHLSEKCLQYTSVLTSTSICMFAYSFMLWLSQLMKAAVLEFIQPRILS